MSSSATSPRWASARWTPSWRCATRCKPASDALFGTAPASGNYNANNDPKLQYDNPLTGAKSFNSLAQQLQIVARMIHASNDAGVLAKRQVFFVSMGGFDTHDMQNRNHADLMAKLAHALRYFDTTLGAMGARNAVTTFTASDFGRTFTSNGDGTDHGWGSHHFVMGGAVRGGDLYGNFPVLGAKNANNNNFDASPNQLGNGALLPETSVDQLGATLGALVRPRATGQLLDLFPNLANYNASQRIPGLHGVASDSERRSCSASATCAVAMVSAPARSAMVRATFSARCRPRLDQLSRCAALCAKRDAAASGVHSASMRAASSAAFGHRLAPHLALPRRRHAQRHGG